MEIIIYITYIISGLWILLILIGLIGSYLNVATSLDDYLKKNSINIKPKIKKELNKRIIKKYYKDNLFTVGDKARELANKIEWYIKTELINEINSNLLIDEITINNSENSSDKAAIIIKIILIICLSYIVYYYENNIVRGLITGYILMLIFTYFKKRIKSN